MGEWLEFKLGELGTIITGSTPKKSSSEDWGNTMCFITPSDYSSYRKKAVNSTRKLSHIGIEKLKNRVLPEGSILVTCIGSDMGKVVMSVQNVVTNQQINSLIPKPNLVDKDFLYYQLTNNYELLKLLGSSGSAIPILNKTDFSNIEILLPPLPEQKAIAEVLSSLDDKIDLLHRQNRTLDDLGDALFREWFVDSPERKEWEKGILSDFCKIITKGTTPTTLGHSFSETGINFIKAESITDTGDFIRGKFSKINLDTHNLLNRSILQEGDVLCSIAGTIGRLAIATNEILPANTNQAIAIIRVDTKKCFPEYVYLFLKSPQFKEVMDGKIVHSVQPNLSLGEIGNTPINIPEKSKMDDFQELITPLFSKKKFNSRLIYTLENLRNILLSKLISGELKVKH